MLIIGNFSWRSETRYIKELLNWHLYYRDKNDLEKLAIAAFGENVSIDIEEEAEGVNLFLKIKKSK